MLLATALLGAASLRAGIDYWRIGSVPVPCAADHATSDSTALVLSGGPDYRRTRRAVALFEAGNVQRIVFSGAGHGGDSAPRLAREARRLGVPAEHVVVEAEARSTYENFRFSCALPALARAERVAIVTDQHHSYRAFATARAQCAVPRLCSAPVTLATTAERRRSETVKLFAYQLLGRAAWW